MSSDENPPLSLANVLATLTRLDVIFQYDEKAKEIILFEGPIIPHHIPVEDPMRKRLVIRVAKCANVPSHEFWLGRS
jgi:hypothetical protein